MGNDINKSHWDVMGEKYSDAWTPRTKRYTHWKETQFLNSFSASKNFNKVLDIGVGNGRILENYLENTNAREIYGIDISEKMAEICKNKFRGNRLIKDIAVCDFALVNLPYNTTFDFISAIRTIKYNRNWKEMVYKISSLLNQDGVAVFDMPNKYSLNVFGYYPIPFYRASRKDIVDLCRKNKLELIDMQTFTRIPDVFYNISNNRLYANLIILLEKVLSRIFGPYLFGRILFIAVKKSS